MNIVKKMILNRMIPLNLKKNKPKKKVLKNESSKTSLELFQSGKSISEIAKLREFTETTIFGHLSKFISSGEVEVTDLISETHYKELLEIIPKLKFENLSDLEQQLDDKYSYSEIRLVLNDLKSTNQH